MWEIVCGAGSSVMYGQRANCTGRERGVEIVWAVPVYFDPAHHPCKHNRTLLRVRLMNNLAITKRIRKLPYSPTTPFPLALSPTAAR